MTIRYEGQVATENEGYRLAIIGYNEEKEEQKVNKMIKWLVNEKGWTFAYGEEEEACFRVYDKDDYRDFVADYKVAKKMA